MSGGGVDSLDVPSAVWAEQPAATVTPNPKRWAAKISFSVKGVLRDDKGDGLREL